MIHALAAWALALGVLAGGTADAVSVPPADTRCGQSTWDQVNEHGVPRPMTFDGWGNCASDRRALWFKRWTYEKFPLPCVPRSSEAPAYQFIWVSNASEPKVPLIDTRLDKVRAVIHRAASAIAASKNQGMVTQRDLRESGAPKIVTNASCEPVFDKVTVPDSVLRLPPYVNAGGHVGLWPWLETHGYPADNTRRYITILDSQHVWNHLGGATIIPCSGSGYGPSDLTPGAQNCNQKGGTWMSMSTTGRMDDMYLESSLSFGERLAHEWAHGMGAVLEGSPHWNPGNELHVTDCAELLCYNNYDADGQHYTRCGGNKVDDFWAFTKKANLSRSVYRLDCGRDDYFAWTLDQGVAVEKPWADTRFAGEDNRFFWGGVGGYSGPPFSNLDFPIPLQEQDLLTH